MVNDKAGYSGFVYFCTMAEKKITGYLNSFFREEIIETFRSEINPLIEVAIINGRYQLNAGNVNYSFGPLHDAFRKYFHKDPPNLNEKSKVLILGLGGGSVVKILREEYNLSSKITGIEIDPAVIEAGIKYFSLDKVKNLEVLNTDAFEFITKCKQKFDLIVVDIYIDDTTPPVFESQQFISNLGRCLKDSGKVVFNKLQHSGEDDFGVKRLSNYFRTEFRQTKVHKVNVNKSSPNFFITGTNID